MKSKRKNNMKKLKLRIAKFDKMLVVQQLEKAGKFEETAHVRINGDLYLFHTHIRLQENFEDRNYYFREFDDNARCDEYAQKLVKWMTEEQFNGGSYELEIGKMCEVSDNGKEWVKRIFAGKSPEQLGEEKRFLAVNLTNNDSLHIWKYAKPINANLTIKGEIYTWEAK